MTDSIHISLWLLPFFFLCLIIGVLSGMVGIIVHRRNFSNLVGGLSHFLLGPIGLAFYIEYATSIAINPYLFSGIIASIILLLLPLDENGTLKQSQHINILWSFGMALGISFLHVSPNFTNIDFFLFGNIITVSQSQLVFLIFITLICILFFIFFHIKLSYLGIDDTFFKVLGINTLLYHKIQLLLIVISTVLLLQIVGILLLLVIITLPPLIASLFAKNYQTVLYTTIGISSAGLSISLVFSFFFNVPVSSFAALLFCIAFFILKIIMVLFSYNRTPKR